MVSKTHSPPRDGERERRTRRVLEEYHRKERQMGRNIDTVTRRENGKERSRGTARTASYIYAITRDESIQRGLSGEHCPISRPVFFSKS